MRREIREMQAVLRRRQILFVAVAAAIVGLVLLVFDAIIAG